MADKSVAQQITELMGTDDWVLLHSGHLMITGDEMDVLEAVQDREVV